MFVKLLLLQLKRVAVVGGVGVSVGNSASRILRSRAEHKWWKMVEGVTRLGNKRGREVGNKKEKGGVRGTWMILEGMSAVFGEVESNGVSFRLRGQR